MSSPEVREETISLIKEAVKQGARKKCACECLGISIRTLQRWKKYKIPDQRPFSIKECPQALTEKEEKQIVETCTSEEYKDRSPNEIVPMLAEKGIYIASESSFYRILRKEGLLKHRSNTKPRKNSRAVKELVATGPDQVWSWDITYLKTDVRGKFYYLYLFMDVWSRMIVGFHVSYVEDGEIAANLLSSMCKKAGVKSIHLHSDNGGPMKSASMAVRMETLGVLPSFSRPSVSNDNPYSESLFKTLKYRPSYPSKFMTLDSSIEWVEKFTKWYNEDHRHSGIKFVTPLQRHEEKDTEILEARKTTYIKAQEDNPKRWKNNVRNWNRIETVYLNKNIANLKVY